LAIETQHINKTSAGARAFKVGGQIFLLLILSLL